MAIPLKTKEQLILMYEAGQIVVRVFEKIKEYIRDGISTAEIDEIAYGIITGFNAKPAFLGYMNYPFSICISINEEVVHGLPSKNRVIKNGDILSIDIGVFYKGVYGDATRTYAVGKISRTAKRLIRTGKECLRRAIQLAQPGNRLGDISNAIQSYAEYQGFSVIRDWVGHGIGEKLHEEPQIPNFGTPGTGEELKPGMVLCFEPMVNVGTWKAKVQDDKWTVVTEDRKLSVHFEDMVALINIGNVVLTFPDKNREVLSKLEKFVPQT
ncbi:MAG: type I methionyl aminopeptidase [Candidatus Hydrogenedentota bacterium]